MSLHQRGLGLGIGINKPGRLKHLPRVMRLPLPRRSSRPQRKLNQSAFTTGLTLFDSTSSPLIVGPRGLFDDRRSYARGRRLLRLCAATLATLRRLHREADRQN